MTTNNAQNNRPINKQGKAMTTQDTICKLRKAQNLTQDDMAEKLGISKNGYGKIERGQSALSLERLAQIAQILGVDMVDIMKNKEMALVIGENHGVMQNNYNNNHAEIEKLQLIIKHQQQRIDDLTQLLSQKDELLTLLKSMQANKTNELAVL